MAAALWAAQPSPLDRGQQAFRVKDWPTAERFFAEALRDKPNDAAVHKWLGMTYAVQEKLVLAEAPFRRACQLDPKDADTCYYYGRTLYSLGRLDASLDAYQKALAAKPNAGRILLGLALSYEKLDKPDEAERYFQQAIKAGDRQAPVDYERFRRQPRASQSGIGPIRFERRDLPFTVRNGARGDRHLPETMIAGIAVLDFNNDGWPDLFFANGAGMPSLAKSGPEFHNALLRNNRDGTFSNVTERAGLAGVGYSMGAAAADFDNDGFPDLAVTGVRGTHLYRNRGDGRFEEVALPADDRWSVAATWVDYDRDGLLDLFIVHYVVWDAATEPVCASGAIKQFCHPKYYQPTANSLYRNLGHGRFADVSASAGLNASAGKGMGVAVGDYDGDGWPDLFVSNDTMPNWLFRNTGKGGFEEKALEAGVALTENGAPVSGMGVEFRDLNNDGRDDLAITALTNETFPLFLNRGQGRFEDATLSSGIAKASLPWTGWSLAAVDLDNDGWKDLVTANGHVMDNAELTSARESKQPCQVYRNNRGASFSAATVTPKAFHRGLVTADFDRDGRPDIVITRLNEPAFILWNRTEPANHWVTFRLHGRRGNRDGIGALVHLETAAGHQWNRVTTAAGYGASSLPIVHFGLGAQPAIKSVTIQWPSGATQQITTVPVDKQHEISEP